MESQGGEHKEAYPSDQTQKGTERTTGVSGVSWSQVLLSYESQLGRFPLRVLTGGHLATGSRLLICKQRPRHLPIFQGVAVVTACAAHLGQSLAGRAVHPVKSRGGTPCGGFNLAPWIHSGEGEREVKQARGRGPALLTYPEQLCAHLYSVLAFHLILYFENISALKTSLEIPTPGNA